MIENGCELSSTGLDDSEVIRNPILGEIVRKVRQFDPNAITVDTMISGDTHLGLAQSLLNQRNILYRYMKIHPWNTISFSFTEKGHVMLGMLTQCGHHQKHRRY